MSAAHDAGAKARESFFASSAMYRILQVGACRRTGWELVFVVSAARLCAHFNARLFLRL